MRGEDRHEARACDTLQSVIEAVSMAFSNAVTACLYCPKLHGFALAGQIYNDRKERFRNGQLILTSDIVKFIRENDYWMALTVTI